DRPQRFSRLRLARFAGQPALHDRPFFGELLAQQVFGQIVCSKVFAPEPSDLEATLAAIHSIVDEPFACVEWRLEILARPAAVERPLRNPSPLVPRHWEKANSSVVRLEFLLFPSTA